MDAPLHMDAVLSPTRSLSRTGLYVLLGVLALFNLLVAVLFLVMGAWPAPIFLGIVTYVLWRRGLDKGTYQDVLLSHHGPAR